MTTSTVHESVLLWLRDDPSRLSALLTLTGHAPCPPTLTVEDSALRALVPIEVSPDLVLRDPQPSRWVLVEVQRRPDEAKARRWPLAMAAMADRHGPRGELVVITASSAVARWAKRVAAHASGETRWGVTPTVLLLGPAEADAVLRDGAPELAVFAAWVLQDRHGSNALALARRAFARAEDIADAALRGQTRWSILSVLHPVIVEKLRSAVMIDISQLPRNPALERWVAEIDARGEARGKVAGEARLLLRVLRLRDVALTPDDEARILAATDTAQVERWTDRALTVALASDLFVEP